MKKEEIKTLLDSCILEVIQRENKEKRSGIYNCSYNLDAFYCVLTHLKDYLIEYGIRCFKLYIKSFDCVKFYRNASKYNLLTYTQEFTLQNSLHNLFNRMK